ncbi:hypothetical protein GN958_ATG03553 [Phytophthora infestans]|uniref:Chromo domain-containing protein n=1 Tax=Phytophthora infestans TaxID=4787 RepID=A0A8S9V351_PHYIN|nr:hypothetical protein GN958_ATG03553 [Phytophthora infestans]
MSRLHDSFCADVLQLYMPSLDRFADRPLPKVSPVHFADGNEGEGDRQTELLIMWNDLEKDESTWERERDMRHAMHRSALLRIF